MGFYTRNGGCMYKQLLGTNETLETLELGFYILSCETDGQDGLPV